MAERTSGTNGRAPPGRADGDGTTTSTRRTTSRKRSSNAVRPSPAPEREQRADEASDPSSSARGARRSRARSTPAERGSVASEASRAARESRRTPTNSIRPTLRPTRAARSRGIACSRCVGSKRSISCVTASCDGPRCRTTATRSTRHAGRDPAPICADRQQIPLSRRHASLHGPWQSSHLPEREL